MNDARGVSRWQLCLLGSVVVAALGCSVETEPVVQQREQALTPSEIRTLGFDEVTDWYKFSGAGTLQASTQHSQGTSSVKVSGMGFIGIRNSTPITKDEHPAPAVVGYDVWVPTNPVNPNWHGDTQLYITAPSAGIYEQYLGQRSFQNLPKGSSCAWNFRSPTPSGRS